MHHTATAFKISLASYSRQRQTKLNRKELQHTVLCVGHPFSSASAHTHQSLIQPPKITVKKFRLEVLVYIATNKKPKANK